MTLDRLLFEHSFPGGSLAQQLAAWNEASFVGRSFELQMFEQYVTGLSLHTERILHIHGTGGMGKSYLLSRYRRTAEEKGIPFLLTDLRDYANTPARICSRLLELLGADRETAGLPLQEHCIRAVNRAAAEAPIVLAFDHYEEAGSLDSWFRETFIPGLSTNVLLVTSGRFPLEGPWRRLPGWRRLVLPIHLRELGYEECRAYAQLHGLTEEADIDTLWLRTLGHPLSLSLFIPSVRETSGQAAAGGISAGDFESLLTDWLREAPREELRELVLAASVPRSFHQELLSGLLGAAVPSRSSKRSSASPSSKRLREAGSCTAWSGRPLPMCFRPACPPPTNSTAGRRPPPSMRPHGEHWNAVRMHHGRSRSSCGWQALPCCAPTTAIRARPLTITKA